MAGKFSRCFHRVSMSFRVYVKHFFTSGNYRFDEDVISYLPLPCYGFEFEEYVLEEGMERHRECGEEMMYS